MKKRVIFLLMIILIVIALSSCVPGDGVNNPDNPAGFLWGVWHGWIAPISLIIGLFQKHIGIYEISNSGWWYNLGFLLAITSVHGGGWFASHRRSKD